jgi:hypothetical protein
MCNVQFDHHSILGSLAVILGIISYIPYFQDIFRGKTKPHPFSWFLWVLMDCVVLVAQLTHEAGAGTWLLVLTIFQALAVALLALRYGEKRIVPLDWVCLVGCLIAISLWTISSDALIAIFVLIVTNLIAFIPTVRKAYFRPHEETVTMFALNSIKWIPAIFALESFVAVNWLFPANLFVVNGAFAIMLLVRRKQLNV